MEAAALQPLCKIAAQHNGLATFRSPLHLIRLCRGALAPIFGSQLRSHSPEARRDVW